MNILAGLVCLLSEKEREVLDLPKLIGNQVAQEATLSSSALLTIPQQTLLVPAIIHSEIPERTTNRITAVYLYYNRRGQWLLEEKLNNSSLSDALAVPDQLKDFNEVRSS